MSGGRLVVMDRAGRDVKRYPLASGLATLGSATACDIRVMLATVCPHHATVAVHNSQTVVRNVGDGETIVNGHSISVAALRHGDIITLGDRSLRWEYSAPNKRQQEAPAALRTRPAAGAGRGEGRGARARRGSAGAAPAGRDRELQLALELKHRASMPASSGGKQVAIVQPQRRDPGGLTGHTPAPRAAQPPAAKRRSKQDLDSSVDSDSDKRKTRLSPKTVPSNTTKATLWIESRKKSPRRKVQTPPQVAHNVRRTMSAKKSTPLRLTVLKKAQSAHKVKVVKIEAPSKIDHTKQAAIMLMTGHTPKSRLTMNQSNKSPSFVVKKPSPVRKTPGRKSRRSGRRSKEAGDGVTPRRASTYSQDSRRTDRHSENKSVTILEISDAANRGSSVATRSSNSPQKSPFLPSPKKSALKDLSKKGNRKTESITFDLSNLQSRHESEVTSRLDSEESMSDDEITLRYSDSSNRSPSPPRPSHSRSSRMLEKVGTTLTLSPSRTMIPTSPSSRKSARGSMLVQKALDGSEPSDCGRTDRIASAFRTRTLSPRTRNMESYSIVDLVSIGSDSTKSIYNSADSTNTTDYGTPNASGRKTRSTLNPTLLGSSTPYAARGGRAVRPRSGSDVTRRTTRSSTARRSKSLSTPENNHISVNSTRVSRASRSRSRINDSDLQLLDETELEDSSPKTSRRTRTKSTTMETSKANDSTHSPEKDGPSTPERRRSPVDAGTPVLSIQSFLNSSQSSLRSQNSAKKKNKSVNRKRKTIGVLSEPKRRAAYKSKSLGMSARQTVLRLSKDSSETSHRTDEGAGQPDNEDTVTPKSAVKLVREAVKNKHSTAKKPQSKRSLIDDLGQCDIVKQLFNSPVKRKLSQSMTEFSRKQLFDDDEMVTAKRPTRNTIAATGRGADDSISEQSGTFTPDRFVSPITTPSNSPNLSGIDRLFQKSTPEIDSADVSGVESLRRTHRTGRSANTPKDRLGDVRVKEVIKSSPNNDLRRVSGVKSLFRRETSPKNDLADVRGVKRLFRRSPDNDLRNVSGVKRTLRQSPRNDLTDVRGVRRMFRNERAKESEHDVSGVEELFDTSSRSARHAEELFDQLVGKPPVRSVYSKTFSTKLVEKPRTRNAQTLHSSLDVITNNVEEWLEQELQKRFHRDEPSTSKRNTPRSTKELQNLVTSTVEGEEPVRASRTRNSSAIKKSASEVYSAHTLPIKKRSLVESSLEVSKPRLPIKKRAVVHSTPVKGRLHVTLNASELGRVSPIAADHDASVARTMRQRTILEEPKSGASKPRTPQKSPLKASPKVSPKKPTTGPKGSPNKVEKSPPKRVTRSRKNTTSENNTKKRRTSLVISKKAPVMSPKADPKKSHESPKKPVTRGRKVQKVETPKRTRAKVQKATVVVPKPSPKLKPQASGTQAQVGGTTRRTRKNTAAEVDPEPPKESQQRRTRGKRNESKGKENKSDNVIEVPKRGRKAAAVEKEPVVTRRGRGKESVQEAKTRSKSVTKVTAEAEEKKPRTRGKKVETQVSVESEPTKRRGRKNVENVSLETPHNTRGKKAAPVNSEPATRGRRAKAVESTAALETKGRKRKTIVTEEIPPKITKTETRRGRKAAEGVAPVAAAAETRAAKGKSDSEGTKTRGRPRKVAEDAKPAPARTTRGRKVAEPKESPVADKRKRKTKVEASPAKGRTPAEAKRARGAEPAGAGARGKAPQVSAAASGRSRRR